MKNIEKLQFLTEDEVHVLAQTYGTPVFIYGLKTIENNYEYLKNIPNPYGLTVRYSVKANPSRAILSFFNKLGAYFDVSSTWEAQRCLAAGIKAEKILMTAQEISDGWEDLCKQGLEFDAGSLHQLSLYGEKFYGNDVSLRVNPGFGSGLVKKLTTGGNHSSFGLWFEQIEEALQLTKKFSLNIKRLHLHIGSGHDSLVLERTVSKALELCKTIPSVTHLNLGGGYKVSALKTDPKYDHHDFGHRISKNLKQFFEETGRKLHLEIEPGTFAIAMAGSLISKVIDVVNTGVDGYNFIKINSGLTELMRPSYYGVLHPMVVVKNQQKDNIEFCEQIVCGHCCIAGDTLTPSLGNTESFEPVLLEKASIGDYFVVERAGGYAASMSVKNFNSYPEAAEVCRFNHGDYKIIKERQNLEQIMQNERNL